MRCLVYRMGAGGSARRAVLPRRRIRRLYGMRGVPSLDSSAMHALEDLLDMCRERGVQLAISHPNDQPMRTMERAGFVDQVGRENFLPNIDAAIARAAVLVDEK